MCVQYFKNLVPPIALAHSTLLYFTIWFVCTVGYLLGYLLGCMFGYLVGYLVVCCFLANFSVVLCAVKFITSLWHVCKNGLSEKGRVL